MRDTATARRESSRARFSHRVAHFEQPEIVEQLEQLAADSGRSLSAEIRAASRYWIAHAPR